MTSTRTPAPLPSGATPGPACRLPASPLRKAALVLLLGSLGVALAGCKIIRDEFAYLDVPPPPPPPVAGTPEAPGDLPPWLSRALAELAQRAEGAGDLEGDGVGVGEGEHPVCGDVLRFAVRLDGAGRIAALRWRAEGCPAVMGVAAAGPRALLGAAPGDAEARLRETLDGLGGLARHEEHALRIAVQALRDAATAAAATAADGGD